MSISSKDKNLTQINKNDNILNSKRRKSSIMSTEK